MLHPLFTRGSSLTEGYVKHAYSDVFSVLDSISDPVHMEPNTYIRQFNQIPGDIKLLISKIILEVISVSSLEPVNEPTPWCLPMAAVERPETSSTWYTFCQSHRSTTMC